MPQIKFSGLVTAMKGKAGGSIFSSNKQGAYFRNNKWGGGRKSARWDAAKNRLTILSNSWRLLSGEQREAWQAAAVNYTFENKFKEPYVPSGYQLYMSLNGNLLATGSPLLTVPGDKRPFPDDYSISVSTPDVPWVTGGTGATFPNISGFNLSSCNDDEECAYGYMCIDNECKAVSVPGSPTYLRLRQQIRDQFSAFEEPECTSDEDCVDAGLSGASADVACQDGECVYVGDGLVYWEALAYVLNITSSLRNAGNWTFENSPNDTQVNGSFRFTLGQATLTKLRTTQDEIVLVSNYYKDGRGPSIRIRPQDERSTRVYVTFGLGTGEGAGDNATYVWHQDFLTSEFTTNSVLQFQINPGDTLNSFICLNSSGFLYGQFEYWEGLKTGPISSWGAAQGTTHDPYANWETIAQWQGVVYGAGLLQASTDVIYSDIRFYPSRYTDFKYALSGMLQGSESILITANGVERPRCKQDSCAPNTEDMIYMNDGSIASDCDWNPFCSCYKGKCKSYRHTRDRFANQAPGGDTRIYLVAAVPVMVINNAGEGVYTYRFAEYWLNMAGGLFANNGATFVPLTTASIEATTESGFYFQVSVSRAKPAGTTVRYTEFINMTVLPADISADWELWDYIKPAILTAPPGTDFWIAFEIFDTNSGLKLGGGKKSIRFKAGADLSSSVN